MSIIDRLHQHIGVRIRQSVVETCPFTQDEHKLTQYICNTDLSLIVEAVLPANVHAMTNTTICSSRCMLQVLAVENVLYPAVGNEGDEPSDQHRMLKFSLTDGHQVVFGFELERIANLPTECVGMKIVCCNVRVVRGLLMLGNSCVWVMGGGVHQSEVNCDVVDVDRRLCQLPDRSAWTRQQFACTVRIRRVDGERNVVALEDDTSAVHAHVDDGVVLPPLTAGQDSRHSVVLRLDPTRDQCVLIQYS